MRWIACTVAGAALLLAPQAAAAQVTTTEQDPAAIAEGARVWANNCTRCHAPRPSSERTDRQWLTIVAHMRARANLTRSDATAVATFLRATNTSQPTPAVSTVGDADANGTEDGSTDGEAKQHGRDRAPGPADASARGLLSVLLNTADLTRAERAAILDYLRALRALR